MPFNRSRISFQRLILDQTCVAAGRGYDRVMDFALIGAGRLGRRLTTQLITSGARCCCVRQRTENGVSLPTALMGLADSWKQPRIDRWPSLILVTVQDTELRAVAHQIAQTRTLEGCFVLHTSGVHTSTLLEPCEAVGALTASWHPLQSFPPSDDIEVSWHELPCAIEGQPEAVRFGFTLARRLGMLPWHISPDHKGLYHAAAALAGNLPNILVSAATTLMKDCGLPEQNDGTPGLTPLVRTCLEGALQENASSNLTGPIARGDRETVERHLRVLPDELSNCYNALRRHFEKLQSSSSND